MRPLDSCRRLVRVLGGLWSPRTADHRWALGAAAVLFVAISAVRVLDMRAFDAPTVLFVVPITLCAVTFGIRGGLASAAVAFGLMVFLMQVTHYPLSVAGYAARTAAFVLVGAIVGSFADRREELEDELAPHRNLSLDLIATASFDGRFTQGQPRLDRRRWATTQDELVARALIEFVHADDRDATVAEWTRLAELGEDTLNFHNRYRHRDGSYRWLEWKMRPDASTAVGLRDRPGHHDEEGRPRSPSGCCSSSSRPSSGRSRNDRGSTRSSTRSCSAAARVVGCEIVGLRMIDENDPSYVVLAASTGVDERLTRGLAPRPVTEGIGGRAIVEERLADLERATASGAGEIELLTAAGVRAAMAAPVYGHGAVVGSLVIATHTDHRFSEADGETLGVLRGVRRRGRLDGARGGRRAPGADRSAHGAAEPRALHRPARPRHRARRAGRSARSRCCSSTSTSSSS